ncbi:hypothetical protein D3C71_1220220 [compost metagenome]
MYGDKDASGRHQCGDRQVSELGRAVDDDHIVAVIHFLQRIDDTHVKETPLVPLLRRYRQRHIVFELLENQVCRDNIQSRDICRLDDFRDRSAFVVKTERFI